jgi:ABC-type lipoprotein release transport system permease subunit
VDYKAVQDSLWLLVAVALGLTAVAITATPLPALRGARVDPLVALRYE